MGGTLTDKHEAEKFVKWWLASPKHGKIKRYVLINEGGAANMVRNCLAYMWEEGDQEGRRAYYRYLSKMYQTPAVRNEVRLSELPVSEEGDSPFDYLNDLLWTSISGYSPGREGAGGEAELVGSADPAAEAVYPIEDSGDPFFDWLRGQDDTVKEILYAWSNIRSYVKVANMFGIKPKDVKRYWGRAKAAAYRAGE